VTLGRKDRNKKSLKIVAPCQLAALGAFLGRTRERKPRAMWGVAKPSQKGGGKENRLNAPREKKTKHEKKKLPTSYETLENLKWMPAVKYRSAGWTGLLTEWGGEGPDCSSGELKLTKTGRQITEKSLKIPIWRESAFAWTKHEGHTNGGGVPPPQTGKGPPKGTTSLCFVDWRVRTVEKGIIRRRDTGAPPKGVLNPCLTQIITGGWKGSGRRRLKTTR